MSTPNKIIGLPRRSPRDLASSRCNDSTYGTCDLLNLGSLTNKSHNIDSLIDTNIKNTSPVKANDSKEVDQQSNTIQPPGNNENKNADTLQLNQKVLYKRTKVTIVQIISPQDDFEDIVYIIKNKNGKMKSVTTDLITVYKNDTTTSTSSSIPYDILFVTDFTTPPSRHSTSIPESSTSTYKTSDSSVRVQLMEQRILKLEEQFAINNTPATIFESTTLATTAPVTNLKQISINNTPQVTKSINNQDSYNNNNDEVNNNIKDISKLLATLAPHHQTSLKLDKFNQLDIKKILHNSINQINANKYFHPLLTLDRKLVSNIQAQQYPTEDSFLYISLSQAIPSHTLKIFTTGNSSKIGVSTLLTLESKIKIPKSIDTIDNMYVRWCNIKRGQK